MTTREVIKKFEKTECVDRLRSLLYQKIRMKFPGEEMGEFFHHSGLSSTEQTFLLVDYFECAFAQNSRLDFAERLVPHLHHWLKIGMSKTAGSLSILAIWNKLYYNVNGLLEDPGSNSKIEVVLGDLEELGEVVESSADDYFEYTDYLLPFVSDHADDFCKKSANGDFV